MISASRFQRAKARVRLLVALGTTGALACGVAAWWVVTPRTPTQILDAQAESYVLLALGLDEQKPGEVDAYFGPAELEAEARADAPSLEELLRRARALAASIEEQDSPELAARRARLLAKVRRLETLIDGFSTGDKAAFADELFTLYGVALPSQDADWQEALDALDALLPGTGTLAFRYASFQNKLIIAPDKRREVFEAALDECRRRTKAHWSLPDDEALDIEWTRDVSAAWHEYRGARRSVLRLNDLTVAAVPQAVDLACHEAYPGHHAQFLLMDSEAALMPEDRVVLLRSPGSLLREGAASFGVELAFTPEERLAFERDVLFPLAGLPADQAATAFRIHELITELSSAAVPIIRDYYDGDVDFNTTSFRLEREAMIASPLPLLEFVNEYGTYSMGYTLVRDMIRRRAQALDPAGRWRALERLIVQPAELSIAELQEARAPN